MVSIIVGLLTANLVTGAKLLLFPWLIPRSAPLSAAGDMVYMVSPFPGEKLAYFGILFKCTFVCNGHYCFDQVHKEYFLRKTLAYIP